MQNFFQGWYFKCCTDNRTIAFIVAVHNDGNKRSASLQIITDKEALFIPYQTISFHSEQQTVQIGNNFFSPRGIYLDIDTQKNHITGFLQFKHHQKIAYDIMGPFKYLPFMQCRHRIYSMSHSTNGCLIINKKSFPFINGVGYLEGDRGYSFPKKYIWTQCHIQNGSLMLSVADIPILNFHFTGIIAIVMINGKEYRIATYLGAKISYIRHNVVSVVQGNYRLTARLIHKKEFRLRAPQMGNMNRFIRESPVCTAEYHFSDNDKVLVDYHSNRASFEFEY